MSKKDGKESIEVRKVKERQSRGKQTHIDGPPNLPWKSARQIAHVAAAVAVCCCGAMSDPHTVVVCIVVGVVGGCKVSSYKKKTKTKKVWNTQGLLLYECDTITATTTDVWSLSWNTPAAATAAPPSRRPPTGVSPRLFALS